MNIDRIYSLPDPSTWLALDLETSGLDPKKHQIIQVGLVKSDGQGTDTRVRFEPEMYEWAEEAARRHGRTMTDCMGPDAYTLGQADLSLAQWVDASGFELLVTFNGAKFDLEFMAAQLPLTYEALSKRMHFDVYAQIVNTKLGYSGYEGNHGLDEMCRMLLGLGRKGPHDAYRDADDTLDLLWYFCDEDPVWRCLLNGETPDPADMAKRMRRLARQAAEYERYKHLVMLEVDDIRKASNETAASVKVGCVKVHYKTSSRKMPRIPKDFNVPESWYREETSTRKNINFVWED